MTGTPLEGELLESQKRGHLWAPDLLPVAALRRLRSGDAKATRWHWFVVTLEEPLSRDELAELEAQLNVRLPEDFQTFFLPVGAAEQVPRTACFQYGACRAVGGGRVMVPIRARTPRKVRSPGTLKRPVKGSSGQPRRAGPVWSQRRAHSAIAGRELWPALV